jgi:rhamnulokinase
MTSATFIAADLGASSGRVMLGTVGPGTLDLREVRRFRNGPVALPDGLHWDVLGLYTDVIAGVRDAARIQPDVLGLAVDSWAVDYGLLDEHGALIGNPYHYRDARCVAAAAAVHSQVDPSTLFQINGLQQLPFNTLYQFQADGPTLRAATTALLIPDLLGYWLTGQRVAEQTNASTTGLLDAGTGDWAADLFGMLGLPGSVLPPIVTPGTTIGPLTSAVRADTGLGRQTLLTAVGSHDTASAVAAIPAAGADFAYISCGTWGLVGVELDKPVLSEATRQAGFTNERGVDGTVRYLRNVMGLWLLGECLRTWTLHGEHPELAALLTAAAALPPGGATVDPNDPVFLAPGDMPARIAAACRRRDQPVPTSPPVFVRCILDSLAEAFAASISDAARLSGRTVDVVHIVGGGSANRLLCQLTANACGLPVVAGPLEATALGNVLIQARTLGVINGDLAVIRELLRETHPCTHYQPEFT